MRRRKQPGVAARTGNEAAALEVVSEVGPRFAAALREAYPEAEVDQVFVVGPCRQPDGALGLWFAGTTTDWTDQLAAARAWGLTVERRLV